MGAHPHTLTPLDARADPRYWRARLVVWSSGRALTRAHGRERRREGERSVMSSLCIVEKPRWWEIAVSDAL